MPKKRTLPEQSRILVLMIEHLGDIVVSTPFLKALRETETAAKITVVVSKGPAQFLEHCPYIDHLIIAEPATGWLSRLARAFVIARRLRPLTVATAIVPKDAPNYDFNELICLLSGAQTRISRVRPQPIYRIKPLKFFPFYTKIVVHHEVRHEAEHRLELIQNSAGFDTHEAVLSAWLTSEDFDFANRFISQNAISKSAPLIAIGIGASAAGRQWPLENYAQVIETLGKEFGVGVVLIIGPSELHLAQRMAMLTRHPIHFTPHASVRQSTALIGKSSLFIGNDSGPMHLAASVGTPIIEISGHSMGASAWSINSPERFGPLGVTHKILRPARVSTKCSNGCVYGHEPHCIKRIDPSLVVEAARELLSNRIKQNSRRQHTHKTHFSPLIATQSK